MITKNDKRLGKAIQRFRKRAGLKQYELAGRAGVSVKHMQYIENAKRIPSLKLVYKIARILDVKVKDLFSF